MFDDSWRKHEDYLSWILMLLPCALCLSDVTGFMPFVPCSDPSLLVEREMSALVCGSAQSATDAVSGFKRGLRRRCGQTNLLQSRPSANTLMGPIALLGVNIGLCKPPAKTFTNVAEKDHFLDADSMVGDEVRISLTKGVNLDNIEVPPS